MVLETMEKLASFKVHSEDEQNCVSPQGLQEEIDAACREVSGFMGNGFGRAFVRPSGTEPVIRVYAEAGTEAEAEGLSKQVEEMVRRHAGVDSGAEYA